MWASVLLGWLWSCCFLSCHLAFLHSLEIEACVVMPMVELSRGRSTSMKMNGTMMRSKILHHPSSGKVVGIFYATVVIPLWKCLCTRIGVMWLLLSIVVLFF